MMVSIRWAALGALAWDAASASSINDDWTMQLLRRQAPGSDSYKCHASCGQVIVLGRSTDYCTNDVFLSSYDACLKCAGPDNENIWKDYGNSVGKAGAACGLPQEPTSGTPVGADSTKAPLTIASSTSLDAESSTESPVASAPTPTKDSSTAAAGGAQSPSQTLVGSTVATTTRAGSPHGTGSAVTSAAVPEFTSAAKSNVVANFGALLLVVAGVAAGIVV